MKVGNAVWREYFQRMRMTSTQAARGALAGVGQRNSPEPAKEPQGAPLKMDRKRCV